jgi:hypothetical protein
VHFIGLLNRQGAEDAKKSESKTTATAKAQRRKGTQRKAKTKSEILQFLAVFLCAFAPLRLMPFSAFPPRLCASAVIAFVFPGVPGALAVNPRFSPGSPQAPPPDSVGRISPKGVIRRMPANVGLRYANPTCNYPVLRRVRLRTNKLLTVSISRDGARSAPYRISLRPLASLRLMLFSAFPLRPCTSAVIAFAFLRRPWRLGGSQIP